APPGGRDRALARPPPGAGLALVGAPYRSARARGADRPRRGRAHAEPGRGVRPAGLASAARGAGPLLRLLRLPLPVAGGDRPPQLPPPPAPGRPAPAERARPR